MVQQYVDTALWFRFPVAKQNWLRWKYPFAPYGAPGHEEASSPRGPLTLDTRKLPIEARTRNGDAIALTADMVDHDTGRIKEATLEVGFWDQPEPLVADGRDDPISCAVRCDTMAGLDGALG